MSKYITEFQQSGNSTIDIDLVCKDWNDRFSIYTWVSDNVGHYTFVVNGKRKNKILCKTKISKEQALVIVDRLSLIHIQDSTFRSAGSYHSESFIRSEIERISKIKQEKEFELEVISKTLFQYKQKFKTPNIALNGMTLGDC